MNIEHKYVVMTTQECLDHLTDEEKQALVHILSKLQQSRAEEVSNPVIVDPDWPEYKAVLALMARRIGVSHQAVAEMPEFKRREFRKWADDIVKEGDVVAITHHGMVEGYFTPKPTLG